MKEEAVMEVKNATKSCHLSPAAVATEKGFLRVMWTVCCVYTEDFQNLGRMHELGCDEDLGKSVDQL